MPEVLPPMSFALTVCGHDREHVDDCQHHEFVVCQVASHRRRGIVDELGARR